MPKNFVSLKIVCNFAPQFPNGAFHAGGRWFESCTHRKWREEKSEDVLRHYSLFLCLYRSPIQLFIKQLKTIN